MHQLENSLRLVLVAAARSSQTTSARSTQARDAQVRAQPTQARPRKSPESADAQPEVEQEGVGEAVVRRRLPVRHSNPAHVEEKGEWQLLLRHLIEICSRSIGSFDPFLKTKTNGPGTSF